MAEPATHSPRARLPAARAAQVWIDFDGTITCRDTLDDLILQCSVDDSWKEVEKLWQAGRIGSRECLEREFALLRISDEDLDAFLDRVKVDPGVKPLLDLLDRFEVPRAVLSDGIDLFIRRTFARFGVDIPVRSNTIQRDGQGMWLRCPLSDAECASAAAHCKCASINALASPGRRSIYIGDGRSDLCPARRVEFVFAKGALAAALAGEGKPFIPFTTLLDVRDVLEERWVR